MSPTTHSTATSTTSSSPTSSTTTAASTFDGISLITFFSSAAASLAIFAVQMIIFLLIRNKLARIYIPKTYLVPERERTVPPSQNLYSWLPGLFKIKDAEIIRKCGLDAYFFLRYLLMMLKIVVPLAVLIIPILCPLNYINGLADYQQAHGQAKTVTGLDKLAFGNVAPNLTHRYWAHLVLSVITAMWTCFIVFKELRYYIGVRQEYLTSPQHRLRASATTVLISSIPDKWLSHKALDGLYDVFPGGIRNIWINRNFDPLLDKVNKREKAHKKLEAAETELVQTVKKAQLKKAEKERKKAAKKNKVKPVEEDQDTKDRRADEAAERMAAGEGVSAGDPHQTYHDVSEVDNEAALDGQADTPRHGKFNTAFGAVGHGIANGLSVVGSGFERGGRTIVGGVLGAGGKVSRDIDGQLSRLDGQLEITNGFANFNDASSEYGIDPTYNRPSYFVDGNANNNENNPVAPAAAPAEQSAKELNAPYPSYASTRSFPDPYSDRPLGEKSNPSRPSQTRKRPDIGEGHQREEPFWKFWETPADGHPSPLPTGYEDDDEFPLNNNSPGVVNGDDTSKKSLWATIKPFIPFVSKSYLTDDELYRNSYEEEFDEDKGGDTEPVWKSYIKEKDRPTARISGWWPGFLPVPPLIGKKVDAVYYWRKELARLNVEIEQDQAHPEKYPLMNSAFIQFNSQAAAHMACQSVSHHLPKQMAPRVIEISPQDVIWDNMSLKWWEGWARTGVILGIVAGMVIFWAIPVSLSSSILQLSRLEAISWLKWITKIPSGLLSVIQGLLPTLIVSILLILVPVVLSLLAKIQGSQTGVQRQLSVQNYYFAFLFVEVSLVVSISGGIESTIQAILDDPGTITTTLSNTLPASANYFFSYMLLQATSTSAGALLQVMALLGWYVFARLFDKTARQKWSRNINLSTINWGSFFPVYTNFACLALIYSTIAPLILIFACITFSLFWVAYRYNTLYVARFTTDTGGLLFPRAVNQTFTGLYIMEFCMFGLFLSAKKDTPGLAAIPQALIMLITFCATIAFQILLNNAFGPLFQYLPITLEDEAVARDEEFELLQRKKFGSVDEGEDPQPEANNLLPSNGQSANIELRDMSNGQKAAQNATEKHKRGASNFAKVFKGDLEANKKMHSALYGDINDEIEDLTPEERDKLVDVAFTHRALRARRPAVWLPRDDTGCSDDEVRRTMSFSKDIWITNHGTGLDSKQRVVYGRNPPDFSEVDLIQL